VCISSEQDKELSLETSKKQKTNKQTNKKKQPPPPTTKNTASTKPQSMETLQET